MSRKALFPLIVASVFFLAFVASRAQTTKSRLGKLDFDGGYPSKKTVERLYESLDLQRAVQAYLWTIPLTGHAQWRGQHEGVFGAEDGDVVYYASYADKLGMLTPDASSPYVVGFYDLRASGPLIIEYPEGPTVGRVLNAWQRTLAPLRSGGKYLVMLPGQSVGNTDEFDVIESDTDKVMHGFRILSTDTEETDAVQESYRAYPYTSRQDPRPTRVITPDGREWSGRPPDGLAYWELVWSMLREESERELDRTVVMVLSPLGIERQKPFAPDNDQAALLEEASVIGEATARSMSFAYRQSDDVAYLDTQWLSPRLFDDRRPMTTAAELDERSARFFQLNGLNPGEMMTTPGKGQVRLITHRDKGGRWLQGENSYRLRIPADPPAASGWSLTVYDAETRSFIETEHEIVGVDSRMDLTRKEDGSIVLYFDPKEPNDEEKRRNWIPTVKDRGWIVHLLLDDPTEAFFDGSWELPDIRRTDDDDDLYGGGG